MKLDKRGKYAGIKVHFDAEDCVRIQELSNRLKALNKNSEPPELEEDLYFAFAKFIAPIFRKIRKAIEKDPSILQERSKDDVKLVLQEEMKKAQAKLAEMEQEQAQLLKEVHGIGEQVKWMDEALSEADVPPPTPTLFDLAQALAALQKEISCLKYGK